MKLYLLRKYKGTDYTIGQLFVDGEYFCDTLEDVVRESKIKHETAIPSGTYKVELTFSAKFKKILPILINVPNFEGIRIHAGNSKSDTSGCILVGENKVKGKVINSLKTMEVLMWKLSGEKDITIQII